MDVQILADFNLRKKIDQRLHQCFTVFDALAVDCMAFWESSVTVWGAEIYVVTDFFKI